MNLANLEKLAQWFEAGAPHFHPDMEWGVQAVSNVEGYPEIPESCGTICCVAGAAALMAWSEETGVPMHELDAAKEGAIWLSVQKKALEWLDLPDHTTEWFHRFGHELFDGDLAPIGAGAPEMAAAIRRVMRGEDPWS